MEQPLLTPNQLKILELASKDTIITSQFFFTGGTALSYFYLKHRFSEDLDFFSQNEYNTKNILSWASNTGDKVKAFKIEQQSLSGQDVFFFHFSKKEIVKIDFAYFPFLPLGKFIKYNNLNVTSVEDIAINKVHALITRNRSRDYFDLYLCMKELGWNVEGLKKNYKLKFDITISYEQLATSFVNVIDAQDEPKFLGNIDFNEIKDFFLNKAKELKGEIL